MPIITVQMFPGRTRDQKRALAKAITAAMAKHCGTRPEHTQIIIQEVERENWAVTDRLLSDPAPAS
jgi:4-oxalocrotonate tautomerase